MPSCSIRERLRQYVFGIWSGPVRIGEPYIISSLLKFVNPLAKCDSAIKAVVKTYPPRLPRTLVRAEI